MSKYLNQKLKKHYFICFFAFLLFSQTIHAQSLSVSSFRKLDNSMTARIDAPKKDKNGDACAVIKIVTTQTGFTFEGDGAGIFGSEYKNGEYWIWVGYGANRLTIKHRQLGVLRDYTYPITIEKATDYEMLLISGKITTTLVEEIESKWLLITASPSNAMIYLDNVFAGIGTAQKKLKPGKYEYRVEAPYYHNSVGKIEIKEENNTQAIQLLPAFGFLQINSLPEDGATIMIDNKNINYTTPSKTDTLTSGEHTVTIAKQMFQPSSQKIIVKDNETTPLTLNMQPNFAEVNISAPKDATIYIDNTNKGIGLWQGRLDAGIYSVEARKEKHITHKKDIEVKAGEKLNIQLNPTPQYGKLDIITTPPIAIITINGKNYGTTPNTVKDLLIGDYSLSLSKEGLETINKTVSIYENKTTEVNEKMASAIEITISTSPAFADLTIDGKYMGRTPQKLVLSYGIHHLKLSNNKRNISQTINVISNGEKLFVFEMPETALISYKKFKINSLQWDAIKAGYAISNDFKFQTGNIKPAYNFQLASRINYFPLMLEVSYSMLKYNNESLSNNINSLTHSGLMLDLCVQPLPYIGSISNRLKPYLGLGMFIGGINAKDIQNNQISYLNTSAAFWKLGLQCYLMKNNVFLEADYQKTISNTVENKFSKFTVSIGYTFKF